MKGFFFLWRETVTHATKMVTYVIYTMYINTKQKNVHAELATLHNNSLLLIMNTENTFLFSYSGEDGYFDSLISPNILLVDLL